MSFTNTNTRIPGKKKINWPIIEHQDINQIIQNNDTLVLDTILPILLNSYINEDEFNVTEKENLLKLLQLSQLCIEYLKYSVGTLDNLNTQIIDESQNLQIKNQEEAHKLKKNIKTLENLNQEYEIKKQAYYKYKQQIKDNPGYKCHLCDKVFKSKSYLEQHYLRRHPNFTKNYQYQNNANQKEMKELFNIFKEQKNSELEYQRKLTESEKQIEVLKLEKKQQKEISELQSKIQQLEIEQNKPKKPINQEVENQQQLKLAELQQKIYLLEFEQNKQKQQINQEVEKEEQKKIAELQQKIKDIEERQQIITPNTNLQDFTNRDTNQSTNQQPLFAKLLNNQLQVSDATTDFSSKFQSNNLASLQTNKSPSQNQKQLNQQQIEIKSEFIKSKPFVAEQFNILQNQEERLQTIEEDNQAESSPLGKKSCQFVYQKSEEEDMLFFENKMQHSQSLEDKRAEFIRNNRSEDNSQPNTFQKLNSKQSQPNPQQSYTESLQQISIIEKTNPQQKQEESKNIFVRKSNEDSQQQQSLNFNTQFSLNSKQDAQDLVNYGSVKRSAAQPVQQSKELQKSETDQSLKRQITPQQKQKAFNIDKNTYDKIQNAGDSLIESSYQDSVNFKNILDPMRQSQSGQDDEFEFSDDKDIFKQQSQQQRFKKQSTATTNLVNKYK